MSKPTEHRSKTDSSYILGLDVGDKRIGVAIASTIAKIPQPLEIIQNDDNAEAAIAQLAEKEGVDLIVIGLPRNQSGEETSQSAKAREFAKSLQKHSDSPIVFADESLSSIRSNELKNQADFKNVSIDSLAACFILEEFFVNMEKG